MQKEDRGRDDMSSGSFFDWPPQLEARSLGLIPHGVGPKHVGQMSCLQRCVSMGLGQK